MSYLGLISLLAKFGFDYVAVNNQNVTVEA